jgi:ABC-2 type transport system ATP-binding protein
MPHEPTQDGSVELVPEDLTVALHRLTGWAIERGISLDGLRVIRPTLEDVYLELTGGTPEAADAGAATEGPPSRRGRARSAGRSSSRSAR